MEAEQGLAGILLSSPEKVSEVWGIVSPEDFMDGRAGEVLKMAHDHFSQQKPFDMVVAASIRPENTTYYAAIANPLSRHCIRYAELVRDAGRKRRIIAGVKNILDADRPADEMLESITKIHQNEQRTITRDGNIKSVVERTDRIIQANRERGTAHGCGTGFEFLDNLFVRYVPGHIWVITGFTSVGKTSMLVEMLQRLRRKKVALISTEMTEEQMIARLIANDTGIHAQKLLSGAISEKEWQRYAQCKNELSGRNMKVLDAIYDVAEIESFVLQESMSRGLDVCFIDYVQNCTCKGVQKKDEGAEMARRFQHLAKRAKTCLVCLSQVSNQVGRGEVEQFEAKGAGEWAAVADVGVRLKRNKDDDSLLMFDMQKGRHYGTTTQKLQFKDNFTKISEWVI